MWHVQTRFTISMHEIEPKALTTDLIFINFYQIIFNIEYIVWKNQTLLCYNQSLVSRN